LKFCHVPLDRSKMPLTLNVTGVAPPAKIPWLARPLTCKLPPASMYIPPVPIESSETVFVPPVCWNKAVAPGVLPTVSTTADIWPLPLRVYVPTLPALLPRQRVPMLLVPPVCVKVPVPDEP